MKTPDQFTFGYIDCALWSESCNRSENDDTSFDSAGYGIDDLAEETLATIIDECAQFQANYAELLADAGDPARNGHDFWLTRNRHGAGFWDRGYGDVGIKLTDAAHREGSRDLYLGDDDKIYQS